MEKFRTGNIIQDSHGHIEIFIRYLTINNRKCFEWISFDSANVSGITEVSKHERNETCFCIENNGEEYELDCPDCKGKGSYMVTVPGEESYKRLAENAKDYLKSLLKGALTQLK